jgi:hypothetical protein
VHDVREKETEGEPGKKGKEGEGVACKGSSRGVFSSARSRRWYRGLPGSSTHLLLVTHEEDKEIFKKPFGFGVFSGKCKTTPFCLI